MYVEFVKWLAAAIEALNAFEKQVEGIEAGGSAVYFGPIPVMMEGEVVGQLRDEIGGAWSYWPGKREVAS